MVISLSTALDQHNQNSGLSYFHRAVASWFFQEMEMPTESQLSAWPQIQAGKNILLTAPTGSGKTLAAFLACIDRLVVESQRCGPLADQTRVLYISPLRALSNDIQKNLQMPLQGIDKALLEANQAEHGIRTALRTGDTTAWQRQKINKAPPHILVTTPESLYILLTSDSGRRLLSSIETVIVDEIHALINNKRGAHLALSLQRLEALCGRSFQRIGLSATLKDAALVSNFLSNNQSCTLVDCGSQRTRDVSLCLPDLPLSAVLSNQAWEQIYDQLVELSKAHRTTLIFVNTRRLAERTARHLAQRLDEQLVATHHGSLSRAHRLDTEQRLKSGQLQILVATASLELGIDIGDVDLVCQIGSPKSISVLLQRVGRSGHGVNRVPKGRIFPTNLDELVETIALLKSIKNNQLDSRPTLLKPRDVLAQQIVAEVSCQDWNIEALYQCFKQAWVYASLQRAEMDQIIKMLSEGYTNRRGRRFAYLHLDAVNGIVRARRAARLTALTNGGAIPELFDYDVLLLPEQLRVGSVNEDFAFESMAGDIFQLGNMSYRIIKVQTGKVFVEDAHGVPPSIPFWVGEAPGRSDELSLAVSDLMCQCQQIFKQDNDSVLELKQYYSLDQHTASQLHDYLHSAYVALGLLPNQKQVIFERFFDDNDDMHLVIHSLYGSRLNRAWGLSLRKRFCRKFNFELQAAALEDSIILSLGATHSFPLEEVGGYLSAKTVKNILIQAMLDAPIFNTHWRWVCNIALAVHRFSGGKRLAPQIQRNNAEDLAAQVFPDQLACLENIAGDRQVPDHPLVEQAVEDCIHDVMDINALEDVLTGIASGDIELVFRDLSQASPLSQSIINARPYAFLDEAPAEERRTQALHSMTGSVSADIAEFGLLPDAAVQKLAADKQLQIRSAEELHDALCVYGLLELSILPKAQQFSNYLCELKEQSRIGMITVKSGRELFFATEWSPLLEKLYPSKITSSLVLLNETLIKPTTDEDQAVIELVQAQLEFHSPITAKQLSHYLELPKALINQALFGLEQQGFVMQGEYLCVGETHWCERRLLARLHRYSLEMNRNSVKPVSAEKFMAFLIDWQGLSHHSRGRGNDALLAVIDALQGYALPLASWSETLKARVEGLDMQQLEMLFFSGQLIWYRPITQHNAQTQAAGLRRTTPIMLFKREIFKQLDLDQANSTRSLSSTAQHVLDGMLLQTGQFYDDIFATSGLLHAQLERALSELIDAGMIHCDSFNALLKLAGAKPKKRLARRIGQQQPYLGRWRTLPAATDAALELQQSDALVKRYCEIILQRYGVVFYSLLARESHLPAWRLLRYMFKRMEARGEILGGRFVQGVSGEQFALKQAVNQLRRYSDGKCVVGSLPGVDPINLSSVFDLGEPIATKTKQRFMLQAKRFVSLP